MNVRKKTFRATIRDEVVRVDEHHWSVSAAYKGDFGEAEGHRETVVEALYALASEIRFYPESDWRLVADRLRLVLTEIEKAEAAEQERVYRVEVFDPHGEVWVCHCDGSPEAPLKRDCAYDIAVKAAHLYEFYTRVRVTASRGPVLLEIPCRRAFVKGEDSCED